MSWKQLNPTTEYAPPPLCQANWYITGKPGSGKTSLVASIPRSLIIDFEGGATMIENCIAERITLPVKNPRDTLVNILVELRADAERGKRRFDQVSIDSLDRWFSTECDHFLQQRNAPLPPRARVELFADLPDAETAYGKAVGKVYGRMEAVLSLLTELRYGWIIIGHLMYQEVIKDGKSVIVPKPIMAGKMPGLVQARSDFCAEVIRGPKTEVTMQEAIAGGGQGLSYRLSCKVSQANKEGKARVAGMTGWSAELPTTNAWTAVVVPAYEAATRVTLGPE